MNCISRLLLPFHQPFQGLDGGGGLAVQALLLLHDFAVGVQDGDGVRVGELSGAVFFEFNPEESSEFENVVGTAAEKGPVCAKLMVVAILSQGHRGVAVGVKGDEN
jgi:hypothetical protein